MSEAEDKQDSPTSNIEPFATASLQGRTIKARGEIGPYKLLRTLGEGGFGIVYLAEQREPVKRRVALKIIKPGMDTKQVIARFEAERQALALLDHPNIAHVFDAGTTQRGRPYFVMEQVKGVPITEYCDRERLSVEDRLGLFIQVCAAIQHAHQKGIIHRDIKPSNILVTIHEDKPLPVVIDFGVAKAIAQPLTEKTLFTEQGQLIGTPAYMSPEQAEMTNQDIDTRSDIYSLGVLLYELLTGALPFDPNTLRRAAIGEIQRIIREEEPPRLSTRVHELSEEKSTQVAQRRRTDIRTLERELHRDLDWITVKALEKERARRYDSAAELGADVKRHLNSEPVHARPPTVSYKLHKFIQRHRVGVIAASLVAAALAIGFILATYGLIRARQERDRAVEAEGKAIAQQQEAEKQRNEAEIQRQAVEEQRNEAKRSLYVTHMLLARQNWEGGRVRRHWELLDSHRPQQGEQDLRGWEWYYLQALGHQNLLTLRGHNGSVRSVAWSRDGWHIASVGNDQTVRIWNAIEGKQIAVLRGHRAPVCSVAWNPDARRLASASDDETVIIWDWAEGIVVFTLSGHEGPVQSVTWSPDGQRLASAGEDARVRIWDATTGEESRSLYCASGSKPILSLAWSPDGQMLAAGHKCGSDDVDGRTTVWNLVSGQYRQLYDRLAHGNILSVSWSPDSQLVALTNDRHCVNVWNVTTEQKEFILRGHINPILSAAWNPDGKRLVSASLDQTIKIWDLATKAAVITLCGHRDRVNSVVWSPDGRLLATGSGDGTIRIWDAMKTEETLSTRKYDNWVSSLSWSPDGQWLATAYLEPEVEIWNPVTEQQVLTLRGHDSTICCVAWRPDGKRLATSSWDKTVKIWHATGGAAILTLRGHKQVVTCMDWSPDGQKLVSGSRDNDVIIWNATTGKIISTCRGHEHFIESAKWSPDGKLLASASLDETIRVWDSNTSEELFTFRRPTGGMISVAWNQDGSRLAGGGQDGRIMVWETNNGQHVFSVQGHTSSARSVTWNPNGRRLASGGGDGTVKIRDGGTGEELLTIHGHKDAVFSVAWSPDGQRLASGSFDYTAKVWDASIGYALDKPQERLLDPSYIPKGKLTYIDLQSKVNQELVEDSGGSPGNNLIELPKGEQIFGGVKLQVANAFIQLGSKKMPNKPLTVEGIKVNKKFTELYIFHGTAHGFPADGTTIGNYNLHYEDSTFKRIPIVLGEDVRDWWNDDGSKAVTRGRVAWIGQNAALRRQNLMLRLYLTVWKNPHPNKRVVSIDYVSTNTDAAPFCVAMTVGDTSGTATDE